MESFEFRVTLSILMERDKIGKKSGKKITRLRDNIFMEKERGKRGVIIW